MTSSSSSVNIYTVYLRFFFFFPCVSASKETFLYCRKKAVEMELAKCKIDIMSLNSQLLDAIQQKLNLSQQLEAWQVCHVVKEAS